MKNKTLFTLDSNETKYRSNSRSAFLVMLHTIMAISGLNNAKCYMSKNNNIISIYQEKTATRNAIYINGRGTL